MSPYVLLPYPPFFCAISTFSDALCGCARVSSPRFARFSRKTVCPQPPKDLIFQTMDCAPEILVVGGMFRSLARLKSRMPFIKTVICLGDEGVDGAISMRDFMEANLPDDGTLIDDARLVGDAEFATLYVPEKDKPKRVSVSHRHATACLRFKDRPEVLRFLSWSPLFLLPSIITALAVTAGMLHRACTSPPRRVVDPPLPPRAEHGTIVFSPKVQPTRISLPTSPGTNIIVPKIDPAYACRLIADERVTVTTVSPTSLLKIAKHGVEYSLRITSLERLYYGQYQMPPGLYRTLHAIFPRVRLKDGYGLGKTDAPPVANDASASSSYLGGTDDDESLSAPDLSRSEAMLSGSWASDDDYSDDSGEGESERARRRAARRALNEEDADDSSSRHVRGDVPYPDNVTESPTLSARSHDAGPHSARSVRSDRSLSDSPRDPSRFQQRRPPQIDVVKRTELRRVPTKAGGRSAASFFAKPVAPASPSASSPVSPSETLPEAVVNRTEIVLEATDVPPTPPTPLSPPTVAVETVPSPSRPPESVFERQLKEN